MNPKRNRSLITIILAAALVGMASCSRLPIYSHFERTDSDGWLRADSLRFEVPVKEPGTYRVRVMLRTTSEYLYTQLKLTARQDTCRTDTLMIDITDDKGNILGHGTSLFQYEQQLPSITIPHQDTLTFVVAHAMSREQLPGITDVGITVERLP